MSETFEYDNLIAGSQKPIVQRPGTVRIGEVWSRGQLCGLLTATGKWQIVDYDAVSSFSDFGVAIEAVDTTEGEANTSFYVEGEFDENSVTIGYSDDADDWRNKLADHGIYLRKAVNTSGY